MTLEEMRTEFRQAKDPKAQIPIIADQALMTPWEVSVLLHDAGEDVDMRWYAQKKNWKPEKKEEPKEEPKPERKAEVDLDVLVRYVIKAGPFVARRCNMNSEWLVAATLLMLAASQRGERA